MQLEQYLTLENTIIVSFFLLRLNFSTEISNQENKSFFDIFLFKDDCPQVREKFAIKLHKSLHSLRLPLHFMAAYSLVPLIKSKDDKSIASFQRQIRESILMNYKRRKEFCRVNPTLQGKNLSKFDYSSVFL